MCFADTEAPTVINCPVDIHQTSDSLSKAVDWTEPTFSDNVKVTKVEKSHASGSTFQLGSTYVSYDAFDEAGNNVQCRFKVELKRTNSQPESEAQSSTGRLGLVMQMTWVHDCVFRYFHTQ